MFLYLTTKTWASVTIQALIQQKHPKNDFQNSQNGAAFEPRPLC